MSNVRMSYMELDSPIGPLVLVSGGQGLCHIEFGRFEGETAVALQLWSERWYGSCLEWQEHASELAEAASQLQEYFRGDRTVFDLRLDMKGTPFQLRVWEALRDIPHGKVCSYKDIGRAINSIKAVRAIGGANNRNPVPIIVPCHRVIGADGSMVGYGGGLDIKTYLLRHEGFAG